MEILWFIYLIISFLVGTTLGVKLAYPLKLSTRQQILVCIFFPIPLGLMIIVLVGYWLFRFIIFIRDDDKD